MQLVGADGGLGELGDLTVGAGRKELGRDRCIQNREQGFAEMGRIPVRPGGDPLVGDPPDHRLDQRLGDSGVHVVHGDVIAGVGRPPQSLFREIPGSHHQSPDLVRDRHEHERSQTRLDILEGHVAQLGLAREPLHQAVEVGHPIHRGVLNHLQDGLGRIRDRDRAVAGPKLLGQPVGVGLRRGRGPQARHGDAMQVGTRLAHEVQPTGGHERRLGGVQSARNTQNELWATDRLHPCGQCVGLDLKDLPAPVPEGGRVVRHERVTRDLAAQRCVDRRPCVERHRSKRTLMLAAAIRETRRDQPLPNEQIEIDINGHELILAGEPVGRSEDSPVLANKRVGVEGEIRGRFAGTGRDVDVGALAPIGGRRCEHATQLRLAHDKVRSRQVADDGRAGGELVGTGRNVDPVVLTDLDSHDEVGVPSGPKQQVHPKGDGLPRHGDG